MHSGLLLVVLATAVTASVAQYYCKEISWGTKEGQAIEEQTVYLSAAIRMWEVEIPMVPPCSQVYGVSSIVCDHDVAPDGHYKNQNHLIVNRKGDLLAQASAKATVYCDQ
ncbi:unnamed protein product [Arctia plantaginis]|uniref:Uncharacterized protein n=1 Tax=Arctia plantaginis TaxID=874455 RepID=A0A8S1BQW7_ARCPL|nr:unnamed protein product [Arctia plantaginis]